MKTKFLLFLSMLILFCACNEEVEYTVNTSTVSFYPDETFTLSVTPAGAGWTFTSANENIASVSTSGIITGNFVGTTDITVHDTISGFIAQVQVTVNPTNTLYREPCQTFYVDQLAVRAYETRTLRISGTFSDGTSYLLYEPDNEYYEGIVYLFSDSLLYFESEVLVSDWYSNKLDAHLNERYMIQQDSIADIDYFLSPDSSTIVQKFYYPYNYYTLYYPSSYTGSLQYVSWSF